MIKTLLKQLGHAVSLEFTETNKVTFNAEPNFQNNLNKKIKKF